MVTPVNVPDQCSAPRGLPQRWARVGGQGRKKDPSDFSAFRFSLSKQEEVGGKERSVSRGVFVGKKRIVKKQPMILMETVQWSQTACANCKIFFGNTIVKTENQRKVQSSCQAPEYTAAAQRLRVQGWLLNRLERQSSSLGAQVGCSWSVKAHTKPIPWPRFKTSVPRTRRVQFYQGCYTW